MIESAEAHAAWLEECRQADAEMSRNHFVNGNKIHEKYATDAERKEAHRAKSYESLCRNRKEINRRNRERYAQKKAAKLVEQSAAQVKTY